MVTQKPISLKEPPVSLGNRWEDNVYIGISQYLQSRAMGYVHHLIKPTFGGRISRAQVIDILVDNVNSRNFGVECKASRLNSLRLSTWFRHGGKGGQLETESEFLRRANRIGIVAVAMREADSEAESPRIGAYLIPWNVVLMIGSREITTTVLDSYVADGFIYKLTTTDGTVWLPPRDKRIFRTLAEMDKMAEKTNEKLHAEHPKIPRSKKGR